MINSRAAITRMPVASCCHRRAHGNVPDRHPGPGRRSPRAQPFAVENRPDLAVGKPSGTQLRDPANRPLFIRVFGGITTTATPLTYKAVGIGPSRLLPVGRLRSPPLAEPF